MVIVKCGKEKVGWWKQVEICFISWWQTLRKDMINGIRQYVFGRARTRFIAFWRGLKYVVAKIKEFPDDIRLSNASGSYLSLEFK